MSERIIPSQKIYICDICNKEHIRPKEDPKLTYHQDALDYSGEPVGNATEKYDLCGVCDKEFRKVFYGWIAKVRNQNEN